MALLISKEMNTHRNIYMETNVKSDRKIRVEIGFPEAGITMETGMLVFIPGYGGDIDSHVWKRMRNEFCDTYNMITMQCDYFGNKYMDSKIPEEVIAIIEGVNLQRVDLSCERKMNETEEEFNDMGIMQALDIVNATLGTIEELERMKYKFNVGKIILFGSSHGSYLSHVANIICPGLYSCILDISAYLFPYYINNVRKRMYKDEKKNIEVNFKQFLNICPEYRYNEKLYDLRFLYEYGENQCNIIMFQGIDDWMVDAQEKAEFAKKIEADIMLVSQEDVDGRLFENANHGLGLDFFEFFQMIMPMLKSVFKVVERIELREDVVISNGDIGLEVSYTTGRPELMKLSR